MRTRIDYLADKYSFTERNESPRLRRQWQDVLEECRLTEAGPEERLRIALLNVDYVTSFELPFRLLLTRTPQLIAALREEWGLSQKNVVFNDKRFGCVYSLKASLSGVPDTFRYHLSHRIRRMVGSENTSSPWQQIAREVKAPRERLKYALETGLQVIALNGLFWSDSQRLVVDILRLRANRRDTGNRPHPHLPSYITGADTESMVVRDSVWQPREQRPEVIDRSLAPGYVCSPRTDSLSS